jgi:hypothetical protein
VKITITMTDLANHKTVDIQVDNQQRIKTTLHVLRENITACASFQNSGEVRIKSSGRRIPTEATYEEAQIHTGAEILLEGQKRKGEKDGE